MIVVVTLLVTVGIFAFLVKSRYQYRSLPELPLASPDISPDSLPEISIVIPARNEEGNITDVVQCFRDHPVVVVDDGSEDRTAEFARAAGAYVLPAPALPTGAKGKPNACLAGARASESEWILFVDADTRYEDQFLLSLLTYAQSEQLDMASVFLRQECRTWPEKVVLPYAFALYFAGVNAGRINSPKSPAALANGQCLLFRREPYQFLGGHGAVLGSVIEDVMLASLAKRHRLRTRVLRAEHLGSVRMYDSFASLWSGFEKNSFRFLIVNPGGGAQVIAASILLTSYLPLLAWQLGSGLWPLAAAFAFVPTLALLPWYGSLLRALAAPLGVYLFQGIALSAMVASLPGRHTLWKGRRV